MRVAMMDHNVVCFHCWCLKRDVSHTSHLRSPETKKRKAVTNDSEVKGPTAKKAKKGAESSSSEESSDEEAAVPAKTLPAGTSTLYSKPAK